MKRANMTRSQALILRLLAAFTTTVAITMAAVSSWDRGATVMDRVLLVALTATVCAGVHLLPALSRRRIVWPLWSACLIGALYGHVSFFTHAGLRAGQVRSLQSDAVVDVTRQTEAIRAQLAANPARPVTTVANELARAKTDARRDALQIELDESRQAEQQRDELVQLAAKAATVRVTAATDPVTALLATVTGRSEESIRLMVGILSSVTLELVGAFLWNEALRSSARPTPASDASKPAHDGDPLPDLRRAISSGECKPTVAGIRTFMGCGQVQALALRRELAAGSSAKEVEASCEI
jgi:hypothetical protein